MNPEIHKLYTDFSRSTVAHQRMQCIKNIQQLENFIQSNYKTLFSDEIDTYNKSYDYRYGMWYKRIIRMQVHYNVLECELNVSLYSRVVDKAYVDRTVPLLIRKHIRPRNIMNNLNNILRCHIRKEALGALYDTLQNINTSVQNELNTLHHTISKLLHKQCVPHHLLHCILEFLY